MKRLLATGAASLVLSLAGMAAAEGEPFRAHARSLGYAGVEAYQRGDYELASAHLEQAYSLLRAPSLGLWSARALAARGKLVEARKRLRETVGLRQVAGDPDVQEQAVEQARVDLQRVEARLPSLRIEPFVCSELPEVWVNGVKLPHWVVGKRWTINPGSHALLVRCGRSSAQAHLDVHERQRRVIHMMPQRQEAAESPSRPSTLRTAGYVGLAAGGVALGAAVVSSIVAADRLEQIRNNPNCSGGACGPEERGLVEAYATARDVAWVSAVTGIGLGAFGLTCVLVSTPQDEAALAVSVAPLGATLSGAF